MNLPGKTVTMARWLFGCAVLIVVAMGVRAEPDTRDLFALCPPDEPMSLIVENIKEHAAKAGLTRELIQNMAESRLRGAGLYDPNVFPYLYINVNAGPPETGSSHFSFFSVDVLYYRPLLDLRLSRIVEYQQPLFDFAHPPLVGIAATWRTDSAGQGDSGFILSSLSQHLDEFLVEYLRVRDSTACQMLRAKDKG